MAREKTDPEFRRVVWVMTLTKAMLPAEQIPFCQWAAIPRPSIEGQVIHYRFRNEAGEQTGEFFGLAVRASSGRLEWVSP